MNIYERFSKSLLFSKLSTNAQLVATIENLRSQAEKLAETISRDLPAFTDHSITHMDALWQVVEQVLTTAEIEKLTTAEAFLLASGFYLHDIGMAYAATSAGREALTQDPSYIGMLKQLSTHVGDTPRSSLEARAMAYAVRTVHANAAIELAVSFIPGTSSYLLEPAEIREKWGRTCGKIAASHHWNIEKLDKELSTGQVPVPGDVADLGYIAAILRLVDYAHINRDRAPSLQRLLQRNMPAESVIHWLAQEQIDGPSRNGTNLVYRSANPIKNVDAWWLFYNMLKGLDNEIRQVRRYLDTRADSNGRFTLTGVIGVESPAQAANYIKPDGFLPLEVHLRTGSISRLVEILAGESLYGPDPMAAVRELIQNSCDAALLKLVTAADEAEKAVSAVPISITLDVESSPPTLEIKDWGIGMSREVITESLLTIASDYWEKQFHLDFPTVTSDMFRPAGKFGIGFLSVFMLGDRVTVTSCRKGENTYELTLTGLGSKGELREIAPATASGTSIKIELKSETNDALTDLASLAEIYAPMLAHPLKIISQGEPTNLEPGWLLRMEVQEFHNWVAKALSTLMSRRNGSEIAIGREYLYDRYMRRYRSESLDDIRKFWPGDVPEFSEKNARLVASPVGQSLLCLRGITLQSISTPGFVGVINSEDVVPDASRSKALRFDPDPVIEKAIASIATTITSNFDCFNKNGFLLTKLREVSRCAALYGEENLSNSSLAWIQLVIKNGELRLLSITDFITLMKGERSVFLYYNNGPWNTLKKWQELEISNPACQYAICFDEADSVYPRYLPSHESQEGTLLEVWDDVLQATLFKVTLDSLAVAWNVPSSNFLKQDGFVHSGSTVFGFLNQE